MEHWFLGYSDDMRVFKTQFTLDEPKELGVPVECCIGTLKC